MILFIGIAGFVLGLWLGAHYASLWLQTMYDHWQAERDQRWIEEEQE